MRIDSFLANLLFGLVILTGFMSLAHGLGDLVCSKFDKDARLAGRMRILILLASALPAMWIFLFKLSDEDIKVMPETWKGRIEAFLVHRGLGVLPKGGTGAGKVSDRAGSWTLSNLISIETESEEQSLRELLKLVPTVQTTISGKSERQCQGWLDQLSHLGVKTVYVDSPPEAGARTVVAVCASDVELREHLARLSTLVERGGALFVVGAIAPEILESESGKNLFQAKSWKKPGYNVPTASLGGKLFSGGGLPAGFRLGLGREWMNQSGHLLAEVESDARLGADQVSGSSEKLGMMISRDIGKGRVVWTSLPGRLSPRLDGLYGAYWNIATARLVAHLTNLPRAASVALPASAAAQILIPIVVGDDDVGGAQLLLEKFLRAGLSASYFLPMDRSAESSNLIRVNAKPGENTFGIAEISDESVFSGDIFAQLSRFFVWRRNFERLVGRDGASEDNERCCALGAYLQSGAPAAAYAAAIKIGYHFVVGDPFSDWSAPSRLMLAKTAATRAETSPERRRPRGERESMLLLPQSTFHEFRISDDEEPGKFVERLKQGFARSKWTGGPAILPIRAHEFGTSKGLKQVDLVLQTAQDENIGFAHAAEYLEWWEKKSNLAMNVQARAENRVAIEFENKGGTDLKNVAIDVLTEGWILKSSDGADVPVDSDKKLARLKISELKPGQKVRWDLVR